MRTPCGILSITLNDHGVLIQGLCQR
jgi:hypothetical protein